MKITSIAWGVILILIGLSIIASKSGYLQPGFWDRLIDFWPFIFIILGLEIISKSVKIKWPFILTIIILIVVPFIVATVNPVRQEVVKEGATDITEPLDTTVEEIELKIEGGAGRFAISGGSEGIVTGRFSSNYAQLVKNTSRYGKRLVLNYKTEGIFKRDMIVRDVKTDLDISLNRDIPFIIELDIGASNINLDFSEIILKGLKINTGASSLDIKLGDRYPHQDITIKAGASKIDIKMPKNVGARVRFDGGLTSKKFHNIDLIKRDDIYETSGYESAEKKIMIDLSSGISDINIYGY